MSIISDNRRQVLALGSLNKNPVYISNMQQAVDGRVICLIIL